MQEVYYLKISGQCDASVVIMIKEYLQNRVFARYTSTFNRYTFTLIMHTFTFSRYTLNWRQPPLALFDSPVRKFDWLVD